MSDFKPGQPIKCTLVTSPRSEGARKTIERLMRRNPAVTKSLKRAYTKRSQAWATKNRGNRDWVIRTTSAKIVRADVGASWTMAWDLGLSKDIKSVQKYLTIEKA